MSVWRQSQLCREIEAERAVRDEMVRRAHAIEHRENVKAWQKKGMRVPLPRLPRNNSAVPAEGTMRWKVMVMLSTGGASAKTVSQVLGLERRCAAQTLSQLQQKGMVRIGESRAGVVCRYKLTVAGAAAVQAWHEKRRTAA